MENTSIKSTISRRSFLGVGATALAATAGLAGCSPSSNDSSNDISEEIPAESSSNPSWLGEAPEISSDEITEQLECDLLIIGAGNAGMTAAVRAAELGLDFILVDKQAEPGAERGFFGAINDATAQESGYTEDEIQLLKELVRYSSGKCNSKLVLGYLRESGEMVDWLADIVAPYGFEITHTADRGVEDDPFYYCPAIQHGLSATEDSDYADYNRQDLFLDYIQQKGYDLTGGYDLAKLTQDESGSVTGAIFDTGDGYSQIAATNVILATGGYADNPEMMMAIAPAACRSIAGWMVYPGNDGKGIKAAMWAGADKDDDPTPMLFDRGIVAPGVDIGVTEENGEYSVPNGYVTTADEYVPATQPFLKVNRNGERFANEAGPYTDIVWAASNQPGNIWCQVFDANYAEHWEQFHTLGCSSLARLIPEAFSAMTDQYVESGVIMKADTLEDLASQLGFEDDAVDTFLATVERYNELYDKGEDEDFGKAAYRLSPIREAPFYGVWIGTNLLTTEDGIKINEKCQALNTEDEPIPGLYAIGDCSGSFFSQNYPYLFPGIACGHSMYEGWKSVAYIAGEDSGSE